MSLAPTAKLTLGNQVYDVHVAAVVASLALLPEAGRVRATLPAAAPIDAAPGDPAALELANGDVAPSGGLGGLAGAAASALGGGGLGGAIGAVAGALGGAGGGGASNALLTGTLWSLGHDIETAQALVADGGAALGGLRPASTYQRQSAKDVIRALADDAGVTVGTIDLDLPLAAYTAYQGRTAAEQIAALAALAGAIAWIDGEGALQVGAWP
jgi:hypothetical protein